MPTYQEMMDNYTIADWNVSIERWRKEITQLQERYGTQANLEWVGEEIDMLRFRIQNAEKRKAELIALAVGEVK
jgi:predicted SpoU family rRNA methylase